MLVRCGKFELPIRNSRTSAPRGIKTNAQNHRTMADFHVCRWRANALSKPFKTKGEAEKARQKLPERERRMVAVGVVRVKS